MVLKCPKCKQVMKIHYNHWVDPLLECKNKSCSNSTHLHRKSKLNDKSIPVPKISN